MPQNCGAFVPHEKCKVGRICRIWVCDFRHSPNEFAGLHFGMGHAQRLSKRGNHAVAHTTWRVTP